MKHTTHARFLALVSALAISLQTPASACTRALYVAKDGTVLTGFKQTETAEALDLRDPATGTVKSIPRSETKSIKTGGTVMPDGLTATLSPQQVADLIRYLSELGK